MKQIDKLLTAVKQAIERIRTCPRFVDSDEESDRLRAEGFEGVIINDNLPEDDIDENGVGYGVQIHAYYATHMNDLTEQIQIGNAIARGIAKANGAKEKYIPPVEPPSDGTMYRVQVGAFKVKENAEAYMQKIKDAGFDAFITT